MKAPFKKFKQLRNVEIVVYLNGKKIDSDKWDEELWFDVPEDFYCLSSSQFRNKKIRVVYREEFIKSELIKDR